MKKLFIAIVMTGAILLSPATAVFAQDNPTNALSDTQFHDRCELIKEKLAAKIATFEKRRETHLQHYKSIQRRVDNIVERLNNAGYNTEPIKVLQPELEKRINVFARNSQQFITDLKQAHRAACVNPEIYQNELQEARESLRETRRSAEAIASFVKNELIPTIRKVISNPPNDEALNDTIQ